MSVSVRKLGDDADEEPRPYDFILGRGDAIPDIEAAIKTLDPGAQEEFDISFPRDFDDPERDGESERVSIGLTTRRPPRASSPGRRSREAGRRLRDARRADGQGA